MRSGEIQAAKANFVKIFIFFGGILDWETRRQESKIIQKRFHQSKLRFNINWKSEQASPASIMIKYSILLVIEGYWYSFVSYGLIFYDLESYDVNCLKHIIYCFCLKYLERKTW